MEFRILGFDPGLSHGALVLCHFRTNQEDLFLETFKVLYRWDTRKKSVEGPGLGINSDIKAIMEFTHHVNRLIRKHVNGTSVGYYLAADFDQSSVNFRTRKIQVVKLAQAMGYLQRSFHEMGIIPVTISPTEIRKWLGLPGNSPKEDVHVAFKSYLMDKGDSRALRALRSAKMKDKHFDILDAFILATFLAEVLAIQSLVPSGEIQ